MYNMQDTTIVKHCTNWCTNDFGWNENLHYYSLPWAYGCSSLLQTVMNSQFNRPTELTTRKTRHIWLFIASTLCPRLRPCGSHSICTSRRSARTKRTTLPSPCCVHSLCCVPVRPKRSNQWVMCADYNQLPMEHLQRPLEEMERGSIALHGVITCWGSMVSTPFFCGETGLKISQSTIETVLFQPSVVHAVQNYMNPSHWHKTLTVKGESTEEKIDKAQRYWR